MNKRQTKKWVKRQNAAGKWAAAFQSIMRLYLPSPYSLLTVKARRVR